MTTVHNSALQTKLVNVFEKYKSRLGASEPLNDVDSVCVLIRAGDIDDAWNIIALCGVEITQKVNSHGHSIAEVAAWWGCTELLAKLFSLGASLNGPFVSIFGARHLNVLQFLKASGNLDVNAKGEHGTTPLQQACNIATAVFGEKLEDEIARVGCVKFLLDNGADINATNDYGRTAIMGAAYVPSKPLVQVLLEYGADVSPAVRCDKGKTAIQWAASSEVESAIRTALLN